MTPTGDDKTLQGLQRVNRKVLDYPLCPESGEMMAPLSAERYPGEESPGSRNLTAGKDRHFRQRVHRQPTADEYTATVRFVPAPIDHDWKGFGELLCAIGAPYLPAIQPTEQESIACPS
jgi:hypothetical protein